MKNSVKINPERLKALRSKLGIPQKVLAAKLGVDHGTVCRWEKGKIDQIRQAVFGRLRMVLQASEDDLCGKGPLLDEQKPDKGAMSLPLDAACLNALDLVQLRYGVSRQQIVEIAPLLFLIAAEQSLRQRKDELRDRREYAAKIGSLQAHLPFVEPNAEPILQVEEASIQARDLFGNLIHLWAMDQILDAELEYQETGSYSGVVTPNFGNELEDCNSPFGSFLSQSLAKVSESVRDTDSVELTTWGAPKYKVCLEEAVAFVGGDIRAAAAILGGYAVIDEMPEKLKHLAADATERANWVREKLAGKYGSELLETLGPTGERNAEIHDQVADTGVDT